MKGSTHKIIAPIFTCGVVTAFFVDTFQSPLLGISIATCASYFSACLPDADLYAQYMPIPVIWAGHSACGDLLAGMTGVKKIYVTQENKKKKQLYYTYKGKRYKPINNHAKHSNGLATKLKNIVCKNNLMRLWASLYRLIGVRSHRCWLSHSPVLWIPLWYALYYYTLDLPFASLIISPFVSGLGLGFISHLIGDACTKSGIPILPKFKFIKKIPIVRGFTDVAVFRGRFFKANNELWNKIVILLIADLSFFLILPDVAKSFHLMIFDLLKQTFEMIKTFITS